MGIARGKRRRRQEGKETGTRGRDVAGKVPS